MAGREVRSLHEQQTITLERPPLGRRYNVMLKPWCKWNGKNVMVMQVRHNRAPIYNQTRINPAVTTPGINRVYEANRVDVWRNATEGERSSSKPRLEDNQVKCHVEGSFSTHFYRKEKGYQPRNWPWAPPHTLAFRTQLSLDPSASSSVSCIVTMIGKLQR